MYKYTKMSREYYKSIVGVYRERKDSLVFDENTASSMYRVDIAKVEACLSIIMDQCYDEETKIEEDLIKMRADKQKITKKLRQNRLLKFLKSIF